jgi:hypothetical protein
MTTSARIGSNLRTLLTGFIIPPSIVCRFRSPYISTARADIPMDCLFSSACRSFEAPQKNAETDPHRSVSLLAPRHPSDQSQTAVQRHPGIAALRGSCQDPGQGPLSTIVMSPLTMRYCLAAWPETPCPHHTPDQLSWVYTTEIRLCQPRHRLPRSFQEDPLHVLSTEGPAMAGEEHPW